MFNLSYVKPKKVNPHVLWAAGIAAVLIVVAAAWLWDLRVGVATSIAPLLYAARRPAVRRRRQAAAAAAAAFLPPDEVVTPTPELSLPETMLAQQRYALLVRPQIVDTLTPQMQDQAKRLLWDRMGLVPQGHVKIATMFDGENTPENVWVEPVLLDRHCVNNQEFFEFVVAGGYQQPALWDEEVLSGLLDFVDTTGMSGPRFWIDGTYPAELANHPVIGISWYEAAAYARWVGKRLPCDAEWVKAGSWPVATGHGTSAQRKYPWGNTMDRTRTNLWGSGPQATVAVGEYASGASVGGLYQLVGNIWEWTSSSFRTSSRGEESHAVSAATAAYTPMKSIRGGAFDTYFDAQATCQFQSGEAVLSRKHNVGFRCALSACDVADFFSIGTSSSSEEPEPEEALV